VPTNRELWEQAFAESRVRDADFTTMSGIPIDPVYGPPDDSDERLADYPGQYPYTRGPYASMYRSKLWTMRMFAGFGTAEDTNRRFKYLLSEGQTGLSTAFDMPTLMGYDSDHERSFGEVGQVGVAISSLADMETLMDGIPMGDVSTSMTINGPAPVVLAFYIACGENQGVAAKDQAGNYADSTWHEKFPKERFIEGYTDGRTFATFLE
jgi:methylmalonyl-CoA mutase N-terminal domain/subunit